MPVYEYNAAGVKQYAGEISPGQGQVRKQPLKVLEIDSKEKRKDCVDLTLPTHSTKWHKMSKEDRKIFKKKHEALNERVYARQKAKKSAPGGIDWLLDKIMAGKRFDPEVPFCKPIRKKIWLLFFIVKWV